MGVAQTNNSWKDKDISYDLLKSFWRRLWALDMLEKIKIWFWILSHKAILCRGLDEVSWWGGWL